MQESTELQNEAIETYQKCAFGRVDGEETGGVRFHAQRRKGKLPPERFKAGVGALHEDSALGGGTGKIMRSCGLLCEGSSTSVVGSRADLLKVISMGPGDC